jgi:membrane-bound inhibitor of C-type lysozyme
MRRSGLTAALLISLASAACTFGTRDYFPPVPYRTEAAFYVCAEGENLAVWFEYERVQIQLEPMAKAVILPRVPSASGVRYSDGELTFWAKESDAVAERKGVLVRKGCKLQRGEVTNPVDED